MRWDDDAAATARVAGLVQFPEQTPRDTSAATKVQTPSYSSDTARLRERRKGASLELIWIMTSASHPQRKFTLHTIHFLGFIPWETVTSFESISCQITESSMCIENFV
jgi:hypothetical protein